MRHNTPDEQLHHQTEENSFVTYQLMLSRMVAPRHPASFDLGWWVDGLMCLYVDVWMYVGWKISKTWSIHRSARVVDCYVHWISIYFVSTACSNFRRQDFISTWWIRLSCILWDVYPLQPVRLFYIFREAVAHNDYCIRSNTTINRRSLLRSEGGMENN